jgi:multidrug efflux pump subunit AcrA (membrane-fusion protein)
MNDFGRRCRLRKTAFFALISAALSCPLPAGPPATPVANEGKLTQITSSAATKAEEIVRIAAAGTMEEVNARVGDSVTKGQPLAHTELYSTKMNLDTAKANFEANGTLYQNLEEYKAATIQREQAEEAVRQSRNRSTILQLELAKAQEEAAKGQYQAQLDAKVVQKIQLDYWQGEYQRRIVTSSLDGTVTEVLVKPGVGVNYATHVFTVRKEGYHSILVTAPAALADSAAQMSSLKVRAPGGGSLIDATVDSVSDDPSAPGKNKILKLFIPDSDIPTPGGSTPDGMKFDVFIPN